MFYLFEEVQLAPKSIEGYRSAIASSLKFALDFDLGKDSRLTALVHSFFQDKPHHISNQPPWDLTLVLNILSGPPFEPISNFRRKASFF